MRDRHFHEPWEARERKIESLDPFPDGCPEGADPSKVDEQRARAAKQSGASAGFTIWGSGLVCPGPSVSLCGEAAQFDDRGVLLVIRNPPYEGAAPACDLAARLCECVNAFAGIADPKSIISEVRDLLRDIILGRCSPDNKRVVSLLSRMIPPEEQSDGE